MARWVPEPQRAPHVCAITHNGREVGPFYETDVLYAEIRYDEEGRERYSRPGVLHISAQAIREASQVAGSPLVVLSADDHQDLLAQAERLADENADLAARLEEAEAALAVTREQPPIDVEALATALIVPLGQHFARKTGPRPREAA